MGDVGVIGFPDESAGEIPFAFVSLSDDAKKQLASLPQDQRKQQEAAIKRDVIKFVADNKVRYKHLGGVEM